MSRILGFLVVSASLGLGCSATEPPPVPLYPTAQTARLPPNQVATVEGPIGKIDGQDVTNQGGRFELLPGCHIVELAQQADVNNFALSSGAYVTGQGQGPATTYALRMKPGALYSIRRDTVGSEMQTVRMNLTAREELPGGATTNNIDPARSADDIVSCKAWAATLAH